MKRHIISINEFLMSQPTTKPVVKPTPTRNPSKPSPSRPSPIRRDRPKADPKPLASTEEDIVLKFMDLLRSSDKNVKINMKKIKQKYDK